MDSFAAEAVPRQDWTALAAELGRSFADRAAILDESDGFAAEDYAELCRDRFFSAGVPAEFGGGDAGFRDLADMLRVLARHSGSTALALSMHTHSVARTVWSWRRRGAPVEGLLKRIAAEQLVLISSGGNDWLDSGGTAQPAEGGFRITARKPFASGVPAGHVLLTSAVLNDPGAEPAVLHFAVPLNAPGVAVRPTWRTLGMRATGSHDVVLTDVFVPDAAVSARRPVGTWHPLMHLVAMIAMPLVYAVYVGVAESARDIALSLVPHTARTDPQVQAAAGEMDTHLAAARLALAHLVELGENAEPGAETSNAIFIARSLAGQSAIACVEAAMELTGGRGFYRAAGLERRFRDVQGARYHPLRAREQLEYTGRMAFGIAP